MPEPENRSHTLIQTKLHRPRLRSDLVPRPRLLSQLECGVEHKVTLISAPAGYGKTTLLCQWLETCPHPFAWLSLDEADCDLLVFARYLAASVQNVYPGAFAGVWEQLYALSPPPWNHLATILVNDLAALPGPLTLALDDYHHVRDLPVQQFLAHVIRYMPQQVHLVIASRTDPPLAIDRLRAGRELAEIRARDLRFSEAEAEAYLTMILGPELAHQSVAVLEQRTEGWIVGLHLASLWLRDADEPLKLLAEFGGDRSRSVGEYLASETLAHQAGEKRQFLLQTSLLDRFNAELCDAVLGLSGGASASMLNELDRANLFLVPLGEAEGWYRYHHLFGEMLRAAFRNEAGPDKVAALHCRASEWFAAKNYVEDALRHALAADDVETAIRLVEGNARGLLNRQERHTLERWLALLPQEAVWQSPQLLIIQGWLLFRQARIGPLQAVLDAAESPLGAVDEDALTPAERAMRGQIQVLRGAAAYLLDPEPESSIAAAEKALAWLPITEPGARSIALTYWALASQALGKKEEAVRRLEEGLVDPGPRGLIETQMFHGLCLLHYLAGDLHQMLAATQRDLAYAARLGHINALTGAHWLAGLLHYEWNDLGAAEVHFDKVLELRHGAQFATTATCMLGLARVYQIQGDLGRVQEMIDGLRAEALRLENLEIVLSVDAFEAVHWLFQGDVAAALRWARTVQLPAQSISQLLFHSPRLAQARILTAAGTVEELVDVRTDLEDKLALARQRYHVRRITNILAHLALVYERLGEGDRAQQALQEALLLAEPGGALRSFVDAGPRLATLLQQIEQPGVNRHYLADLLAAFDVAAPSGPAQSDQGADLLLTRREEEILRLMGVGLTNKEIAAELVISVHTVKRHATNIYHKLDVTGRRQAVYQGRRLGILPPD